VDLTSDSVISTPTEAPTPRNNEDLSEVTVPDTPQLQAMPMPMPMPMRDQNQLETK
jgi:hypothetical protein